MISVTAVMCGSKPKILFAQGLLKSILVLTLSLSSLMAVEDSTQAPPSSTEKTQEALTKLTPLLTAKDFNAAHALLDGILSTAASDSYDRALASDIKAKIFLQNGELVKALPLLEVAVQIGELHPNYFSAKDTLDNLYYLAQICYQEGSASKDYASQRQLFDKSLSYMKRWFKVSPKKDPDAILFYASILYNQAVIGGDKVDLELIKQARHEIEEGLLTSIKPKDGFYMLLAIVLQQEGDLIRSTEILQLLLKQKPENKAYWQQLMSIYSNLAANEKDESKARQYYALAINSLEKAQSLGLLKDPKDNYNLVSVYFNAGQFGKSTELLYTGLKNGSIESDPKTWQVLAYSYQQVNQELQAIAVLKEAANLFPTNGQLNFLIGQIYSQIDNIPAAFEAYQSAVTKGNLEKPYAAIFYLAYSAFDLQKYEIALKAVLDAEKMPEAQKDSTLPKMKAAIEEAIKDREAAKAAIDGKK